MPAGLSERLTADAEAYVDVPSSQGLGTAVAASLSPSKSAPRVLAFIGGAVIGAVAASILVALILTTSAGNTEESSALALKEFLQSTADAELYPWEIKEEGYEAVYGHVAWSAEKQAGFMFLDGLPANDPAEAQYQLWIVDPTRDEFPVDGGVFNVSDHLAADGKAYVPIDVKLRVDQPAAFALTLEKPGGVVKSNNALLVVAAVQ